MKKTMAIALLAVFGCWSLGIAAVNPEYEKGGASLTQAGKGPRFVPGHRITSYNVCYTKLLRCVGCNFSFFPLFCQP